MPHDDHPQFVSEVLHLMNLDKRPCRVDVVEGVGHVRLIAARNRQALHSKTGDKFSVLIRMITFWSYQNHCWGHWQRANTDKHTHGLILYYDQHGMISAPISMNFNVGRLLKSMLGPTDLSSALTMNE